MSLYTVVKFCFWKSAAFTPTLPKNKPLDRPPSQALIINYCYVECLKLFSKIAAMCTSTRWQVPIKPIIKYKNNNILI